MDGGVTHYVPAGGRRPPSTSAPMPVLYAHAVEGVEGVVGGPEGGPEGQIGEPEGPGGQVGEPEGPGGQAGEPEGPGGQVGEPEGPGGPGGEPGEVEGPGGPGGEPGEVEGPGGPGGEIGGPDGPPTSWEDAQQYSNEFAKGFNPGNKPKQPSKDLEVIYQLAGKAHQDLVELTETIAQKTGGKARVRLTLKAKERSQEKVTKDYDGDASNLLDVDASTVVYKDVTSVYEALAKVRELYGEKIVYFKDRFVKPVPSGFRDILMNVKLPNGSIAELRLGEESIQALSDQEHGDYEVIRSWKEPLSKEQEEYFEKTNTKWKVAYQKAFDEANQRWG